MSLNLSENVYGYEITEPEITQNNPIFRMSNYGMEYKIEITVTLNAKPDTDRVVFVIASGKGTIMNQILRIIIPKTFNYYWHFYLRSKIMKGQFHTIRIAQ